MARNDYAYPFAIDGASRQGARAPYATHVEQMIRQVLLTAPGERVNMPDFGCGLRQLVFAPSSEALVATARVIVKQALDRWLAAHIVLQTVDVTAAEGAEETITVEIAYTLIETRETRRLEIEVR